MSMSEANEPHDIHTLPHSLLFLLPFGLSPSLPFGLSPSTSSGQAMRSGVEGCSGQATRSEVERQMDKVQYRTYEKRRDVL
jgi:hypothetical protein